MKPKTQALPYVEFTKEMIPEYTILVPNMLPMHFKMILAVLKTYGYHMELLETSGPQVIETGLKYVHNDTCYPAILVIGQFMEAIQSGRYDPHKVALIQFQTGGGCRASNYISLLRKALQKAGYGYVPVISFSLAGLETHSGFQLTLPKLHGMLYSVLYGDLLMTLVQQTRPYEVTTGSAQRLADEWTARLGGELGHSSRISYRHVRENYRKIVADFAQIPTQYRNTVQVGVVGEIFVKYSPLGNNNLEDFLVREGAEVHVPGLVDFCLYCVYNGIVDYKLYGRGRWSHCANWAAYRFLCKKKNDMCRAIASDGRFIPPTPFERTVQLCRNYIGIGTKMGEGWLLTAEMLELAENGVKNIVCTQPFGCLPNHICGKGMMKPIKARNPDVNIVAIDYDSGAAKVNQENRLKLMLANARRVQSETHRERPQTGASVSTGTER